MIADDGKASTNTERSDLLSCSLIVTDDLLNTSSNVCLLCVALSTKENRVLDLDYLLGVLLV